MLRLAKIGDQTSFSQRTGDRFEKLGTPRQHDTVAGAGAFANISGYPSDLPRLITKPVNANGVGARGGTGRGQCHLAGRPVRVASYHIICQFDHRGRAAIALRKLDNLHVVITAQIFETRRAGAVPLVDDLIVIGDDEQIGSVHRTETSQDQVLTPVGVLILVHANVSIDDPIVPCYTGTLAKQTHAAYEKRSVIKMISGHKYIKIGIVDRPHPLLGSTGKRQRRSLRTVEALAKQMIDHAYHTGASDCGQFRRIRLANRLVEYADPILLARQNLEVRAQPQVAAVLTEHLGAEGMKRGHTNADRLRTEQLLHPFPHLVRRLGGERQPQHSKSSIGILANQTGDAPGQHRGLARSRPGQHEQRSPIPLHRLQLVCVHAVQCGHDRFRANSTDLSRIDRSNSGTGASFAFILSTASNAARGLL